MKMKYQPIPESDYPTFDLKGFMKKYRLSFRDIERITGMDHSYIFRLTKESHIMSYKTSKKFFEKLESYVDSHSL